MRLGHAAGLPFRAGGQPRRLVPAGPRRSGQRQPPGGPERLCAGGAHPGHFGPGRRCSARGAGRGRVLRPQRRQCPRPPPQLPRGERQDRQRGAERRRGAEVRRQPEVHHRWPHRGGVHRADAPGGHPGSGVHQPGRPARRQHAGQPADPHHVCAYGGHRRGPAGHALRRGNHRRQGRCLSGRGLQGLLLQRSPLRAGGRLQPDRRNRRPRRSAGVPLAGDAPGPRPRGRRGSHPHL